MIQSGKKTIIGIIGIGKWGQNLLRNFAALETCEIKYVCDGDQARLDKFSKEYPSTRFITEIDLLLKDNAVEAIVIATPLKIQRGSGSPVRVIAIAPAAR